MYTGQVGKAWRVHSDRLLTLLSSRRWPELDTPYDYDTPCPRCQITYEYSVELMVEVVADIMAAAQAQEEEEAGEVSDSEA